MALDTRVAFLGHVWMTKNYLLWLFLLTTILTLSVKGVRGRRDEPEFHSPVKNISSHAGSNIDLSCNVKNVGDSRIMWLKKETDRETLLAINALKITKNPKISVSLLQSSGDLSQSILYIYNIDKNDDGVYHCIVNTSPMIVQVGTLEVKDSPEPVQIAHFNPRPTAITRQHSTTSEPEQPVTTTDSTNENNREIGPQPNNNHSQSRGQDQNVDGDVFCLDYYKIWNETKYLFSWVVTKLRTIF